MLRIKRIIADARPPSRIQVSHDVADLFREVARREGRELDDLLNDMLLVYVRARHPEWELETEPVHSPPPKADYALCMSCAAVHAHVEDATKDGWVRKGAVWYCPVHAGEADGGDS